MEVHEAVKASLRLLTSRDRKLLAVTTLMQMATSLLDLAGVLLLGLVGALSVTIIQSQPVPPAIADLTQRFGLAHLTDQQMIAGLAGAAALFLLAKSVVSSTLTRRIFTFLANRQALVTARLVVALLQRPLTFVQSRSSQATAYALIQGAGSATLVILGQLVVAITEVSLLVVLGAALLLLDPLITVFAIVYFGLVAVALQRAMGSWASRLGTTMAVADVASLNAIQEVLSTFREVSVSRRRDLYAQKIQDLRWQAARVAADRSFIVQVPKYIFEAALVLGGLCLAGFLFATKDSVAAVGTLALFLAAATRVMPSLLRLQGATLALRDAAGAAAPTFELAAELGNPEYLPVATVAEDEIRAAIDRGHVGFTSSVEMENVSFHYPGTSEEAVSNVSISVDPGQSLALVGRSGAGKSTIADLVLGVLEPTAGVIRISGQQPESAIERWPGAVAYVPQETVLINGTVRENVALGLPAAAIDDDRVWRALERTHIASYLRDQRDGLDTPLGERGLKLSGGQKQRLGIARALYTDPMVVVLDEATSALDSETEEAITTALSELEGHVTTIIIAHRLSTVRHVDVMVYLDRGAIVAQGSFEKLRMEVPALARQADLMGLR